MAKNTPFINGRLGGLNPMNLVPKPAPLIYDLNLYVEVNTVYREQYENNESL